MNTRTHKINEAARLAGVSVRTLHYYDQIELLMPSNRSAAGYRLYTDSDLLRLQQIQIGRTVGLALEDIRSMLDDPEWTPFLSPAIRGNSKRAAEHP